MTSRDWLAVEVYVAVVGAIFLIGTARAACDSLWDWYAHRRRKTLVRRVVFRDLNSAAANGCFEPGGQLHNMTADEIAYDMTRGIESCDEARPERLTPFINEWLGRNRKFVASVRALL